MYIGILDADALQFSDDFFPSLDVMKTASYHWGKGDYVELILDVNSALDKYDEFYIFKTNINGDFLSHLKTKKCHYYNNALYGNTHIHLGEIENSFPKIEIYKRYFDKIYGKNKVHQKNIEKWNKAKFFRFYNNSNDNSINFLYISKYLKNYGGRANVYIYDNNIFKEDSNMELILEILSKVSNITFLNKQRFNDLSTLMKINTLKGLTLKNQFIYDGEVNDKIVKQLCEFSKSFKREVRIEVGKDIYNNYTEIYMKNLFKRVLNWCIYISIYGRKLNFVVHPEVTDSSYKTLISLASFWIKFSSTEDITFYDHAINTAKQKTLFLLQELVNKDSEIKRLSNISPIKIKKEQGVWLL